MDTVNAPADEVVLRSRMSPSRASDFLTCPLLFRYRQIDRLPEPPSPAAVRGTLVHAVLEDLLALDPAARTPETAASLVDAAWERVQREDARAGELFAPGAEPVDQAAWFASVADSLNTYFTLEDPRTLVPGEREVQVEQRVEDRLTFNGIVDRIDVAPDGRIRVVDYKTGKRPSIRFQDKALFQMKFYALVIWRTRGVMPSLVQLMYLGDGQILRHTPTEAELLATERKVLAVWDAVTDAVERRSFAPQPSGLCRFCAHRDHCPEGGGEILPMPTVRIE